MASFSSLARELQDDIFTRIPMNDRKNLSPFLHCRATHDSSKIAIYTAAMFVNRMDNFKELSHFAVQVKRHRHVGKLVRQLQLSLYAYDTLSVLRENWREVQIDCTVQWEDAVSAILESTPNLEILDLKLHRTKPRLDNALENLHKLHTLTLSTPYKEAIMMWTPHSTASTQSLRDLRDLKLVNVIPPLDLFDNVTDLAILKLNTINGSWVGSGIRISVADELCDTLQMAFPSLQRLNIELVRTTVHEEPRAGLYDVITCCIAKPLEELRFVHKGMTYSHRARLEPVNIPTINIPTLEKLSCNAMYADFCPTAVAHRKIEDLFVDFDDIVPDIVPEGVIHPPLNPLGGLPELAISPLREIEFWYKHVRDGELMRETLRLMKRRIEAGCFPNLRKVSLCAGTFLKHKSLPQGAELEGSLTGQEAADRRDAEEFEQDVAPFFNKHSEIELDVSRLKRFVKPWMMPIADRVWIWGRDAPLISADELSKFLRADDVDSARTLIHAFAEYVFPTQRINFRKVVMELIEHELRGDELGIGLTAEDWNTNGDVWKEV
ncbi:hypothetical protein EJ08DRAFT_698652 [Tothia fuscella]|uniref:Uncharacterized protein n=1 Tax=Tothia fuscella TaxID=1048955 RepID=A0A9P4NPR8_9PEZI|nr:hypothetical protein EJ08DRAFT_698652 [Tothia fuscella]